VCWKLFVHEWVCVGVYLCVSACVLDFSNVCVLQFIFVGVGLFWSLLV